MRMWRGRAINWRIITVWIAVYNVGLYVEGANEVLKVAEGQSYQS